MRKMRNIHALHGQLRLAPVGSRAEIHIKGSDYPITITREQPDEETLTPLEGWLATRGDYDDGWGVYFQQFYDHIDEVFNDPRIAKHETTKLLFFEPEDKDNA